MRYWQYIGLVFALCVFGSGNVSAMSQRSTELLKRVVGGSDASDEQFPFTVYISNAASTNNTACAGAILTEQIVVTAAYCVYDIDARKPVDPSTIRVGYGKTNKVQQPVVNVEKIIIGDSYNSTSGVNDIALLQVNLASQISASVNRIPVYVGDIRSGDSLIFMGWGSTDKIGVASSDVLNYANVTVGDDYSCGAVDLYQNSNGRAVCTRNKLTPGVAPCLGDYGGPLIKYDQGVAKLVGLFSTFVAPGGQGLDYCANNNTLAYYTHVGYYMSFLESKTQLSANAFTGNDPLTPPDNNSGLSKGAIAGISVAAAIAFILLCLLVYVIRYSMKKRREVQHEQRIYELGLQQLADELGGTYEPKTSSAMSAFHSSGITHMDDNYDIVSRASMFYRHIRHSTYSDVTEQPFSENIPQSTEVGTELTMDSLSKTYRHTDGSPKVMDYIRPERDGKITDYYRHLLFYELEDADKNDDLISL
ncbi:hypothetical protein H4S08_004204 [Coemansia sp. RSA 1365]|nr:hypothetical protein H4S08_004204 [Coemansia sp. RSA 1365]